MEGIVILISPKLSPYLDLLPPEPPRKALEYSSLMFVSLEYTYLLKGFYATLTTIIEQKKNYIQNPVTPIDLTK